MISAQNSGLHRLFTCHARQTVGEYIAQLRIGKACSLLISTDRPISYIVDESRYTSLSHFNRQFLAIKQVTPRELRRTFMDHESAVPRESSYNPHEDLSEFQLSEAGAPPHA